MRRSRRNPPRCTPTPAPRHTSCIQGRGASEVAHACMRRRWGGWRSCTASRCAPAAFATQGHARGSWGSQVRCMTLCTLCASTAFTLDALHTSTLTACMHKCKECGARMSAAPPAHSQVGCMPNPPSPTHLAHGTHPHEQKAGSASWGALASLHVQVWGSHA